MPVPCFFTHSGGNQHVSFTLDLWWWPGRKFMGRTPAWKINCAYLVSANGELLHLEPENGDSSTSFLPSSNTCCQYFSCRSSSWAGMMWVKVLMWLYFCGNCIYLYICLCVCVWLYILVEFQVHCELMNSVTGEGRSISVSLCLGEGTQQSLLYIEFYRL